MRHHGKKLEAQTTIRNQDTLAAEALHTLRLLFKDHNATFRSPEQQQLVELALERNNNILAIIPTGGGKSLAWEAPLQVEKNTISIVFTPFIPLIDDQLRRASEKGIRAMHWTMGKEFDMNVQLIFISWDLVGRPQVFK